MKNISNTPMPPNDIPLERIVLGAILIDENAYDKVREIIEPAVFYDQRNRHVFEAIEQLAQEATPIDIITVSDRLSAESDSYVSYVTELAAGVCTSANLQYHAEMLRDKYIQRELINVCDETERDCYNNKTVSEMLTNAEERIYQLSTARSRRSYNRAGDVFSQVRKQIDECSKSGGIDGIPTGYIALDREYGGLQASDLIVIASRPSMGKTSLALSMASSIMQGAGFTFMDGTFKRSVGFFSLEMSREQIVRRLLTQWTGIAEDRIKSIGTSGENGGTKQEKLVLSYVVPQLEQVPLFIDDGAGITVSELCSKARRMVREEKVSAIFIDYLQLLRTDGEVSNREQEVSAISRRLKQLAKELSIPVVALSQLNRGIEQRTGASKRPILADIRESGAIEQDADQVIMLHRPEYYNIKEDTNGESTAGVAELIVAKNRNGKTGTIRVRFVAEAMRFDPDPSED